MWLLDHSFVYFMCHNREKGKLYHEKYGNKRKVVWTSRILKLFPQSNQSEK